MAADIISLSDARKSKEPHITGDALCLFCSHEWVAVAPIGTDYLDCLECKTQKGVFLRPVFRQQEQHYTCNCGCQYFHIIRSGAYCPNCGKAWPFDFFHGAE